MQLRKLLMVGALFTSIAAITSGCAYRTDLAQGNFVEQEAVDQLRQGMSAAQVQYILGTPMLTDPFDNSRWYYVYFLRKGWDEPEIKNLVVLFQGNTLYDVSGDFKKPDAFYDGSYNIQKINFGALPSGSAQVQQQQQAPQAQQATPDAAAAEPSLEPAPQA